MVKVKKLQVTEVTDSLNLGVNTDNYSSQDFHTITLKAGNRKMFKTQTRVEYYYVILYNKQ